MTVEMHGRRAYQSAYQSVRSGPTTQVLACFGPTDPAHQSVIASVRGPLLTGFLGATDRTAAAASLSEAARIRHEDPATLPEEHVRIDHLCRNFAT
jgi:hypothetical protein